jgi:hypothetical protein
MDVPQKYGGFKVLGMVLMVVGAVILAVGLIIGLVLLTGNFWPGYNQGFNLIGWGPVLIGLANGVPLLAIGALLRLLTEVEHNSRVAVQMAELSRKSAEVAMKNSEALMKSTEALLRSAEAAKGAPAQGNKS